MNYCKHPHDHDDFEEGWIIAQTVAGFVGFVATVATSCAALMGDLVFSVPVFLVAATAIAVLCANRIAKRYRTECDRMTELERLKKEGVAK